MSTRPRSSAYPKNGAITIAAGKTHPINKGGNFIHVLEANEEFTIRMDSKDEFAAGQNRKIYLDGEDAYEKLEVINDSGSDLTFQLVVGFGRVESDDVTISGQIAIETPTGMETPAAVSVINGGGAQTVLSASTARRQAVIMNTDTSNSIWIGDSNVDSATGRGIELAPGMYFTFECEDALYADNTSGGNVSVSIMELSS